MKREFGWALGPQNLIKDSDSQYQGDDNSRNIALSTGIGATTSLGTYLSVYPWEAHGIGLSKYPQLSKMRRVGAKHGFRMVSANIPEFFDERLPTRGFRDVAKRAAGYAMFGELQPTRRLSKLKGFQGVTYIQSGEYAREVFPMASMAVNFGNWSVGADKLATWRHLEKTGAASLHVPTIAAEEFYERKLGRTLGLTEKGKVFLEQAGGTENLVVKLREAARGTGVWMNAEKLPSSVAESLLRSPEKYLIQQRLNLAEEFRVVTVGGKAAQMTYRFGTPTVRKLASFFGFAPTAQLAGEAKKARVSPFETIQPVLRKDYRVGLEAFAEKVARELPYEIGALDIGLTKGGKFALIEAQRSFGNISNPVVSRRIRQLVTGKAGPGALIGSLALGLAAGIGTYNQFSGKDDEYNTIEGLNEKGLASKLRKENTDFGSGWKGILTLPKSLQTVMSHMAGYTAPITEHMRIIGAAIGSSDVGLIEKARMWKDLLKMGTEMSKGPFRHPIFINPLGIRQATESMGGKYTYGEILKGTIRHERFHQKVIEQGLRSELQSLQSAVPSEFSQFFMSQKMGPPERMAEEYFAHALNFPKGKRPGVFLGATNLFSGRDDAWNSIEGFLHGGLSERLRKFLTPFGSGYDPIRAVAKAMGKSFEDIVGSRAFKEALGQGRFVRKLGEGAFGKAELMEGMFQGQAFQYVKKTQREFDDVVERLYKNTLAADSSITREEARQFASKHFGLSKEAAAQRSLGLTETVPSVYQETEKELFMEAMPGESVRNFLKTGQELPEQARKAIYNTIEEAAQQGIFNPDIHYGNLLFDPNTGRASWIDWGMAQQTPTPPEALSSFMERKITPLLTSKKATPIIDAGSTVAVKARQTKSTKIVGNPTPQVSNAANSIAFDMTMPQKSNIIGAGGGTQPGLELVPKSNPTRFPNTAATVLPPTNYKANFVRPMTQSTGLQASAENITNAVGHEALNKTSNLKNKHVIQETEGPSMISGLQDIGYASTIRKSHSDCGSGYRGLKGATSNLVATLNSGPGRAKSKLLSTVKDLKTAQKKLWNCANSGGRYHTNYKKTNITQISSDLGGGL